MKNRRATANIGFGYMGIDVDIPLTPFTNTGLSIPRASAVFVRCVQADKTD